MSSRRKELINAKRRCVELHHKRGSPTARRHRHSQRSEFYINADHFIESHRTQRRSHGNKHSGCRELPMKMEMQSGNLLLVFIYSLSLLLIGCAVECTGGGLLRWRFASRYWAPRCSSFMNW